MQIFSPVHRKCSQQTLAIMIDIDLGLIVGLCNGYKVSFWSDEIILKLAVVMVVKLYKCTKNQ